MLLRASCLLLCTSVATAAPPTVEHLFPAGAARGQAVTVTVAGKLDGEISAWCDRTGLEVSPGEKDKFNVTIAPDAQLGPCWIRLYNAEGASVPRRFIIGTLPEVVEKETNDRLTQATAIEGKGVVANGVLSKNGDVDVYAVPLKQGQTLVAALDARERLGSPMDAVLQVVSPRGFVLEQNDDERGFDPQIVFAATEEGTYFVRTFAFPETPNSSIRFSGAANYIYRLTLTTGPYVDHAWPLAVHCDTEASVDLHGWNLPQPRNPWPIGASSDARLASIVGNGWPGLVPLRIEGHAVAVETDRSKDATPQEVTIPSTITGRIGSAGEVDAYRFQAKKGDKLEFQVESLSFGYRLDPVLRLVDTNGQTLVEVDDVKGAADPVLTRTIPADGEYRIEVRDRFGHGGFRYVYRLRCLEQGSNYALSLKADQFVLSPEKPLEIPVAVDRLSGFPQDITVSVEGLPEGVTAEPVTSPAKGNEAKAVKLVLKSEAAGPFSGPIRIVGRSMADPTVVRIAEATPDGIRDSLVDVWLTVTGGK